MATVSSLADRTKTYLPDDFAELDLTERRDAAVAVALEEVSDDLPNVLRHRVTSQPVDATGEFANWDEKWSQPVHAEWPALSDTLPFAHGPSVVPFLYDTTGDIEQVRFENAFPSVTAPILVGYTVRWTAPTLPSSREELVAVKASVILALMLAGAYGSSEDLEFRGEIIQVSDEKIAGYAQLAESLEKLYRDMLGRINEKEDR